MKKHFDILGLTEGASKEAIQEAYDRLSIELDPKRNDFHEFFLEEYTLLQEAYDALINNSNILENTSQQKKPIPLSDTTLKKPDIENKVKSNKNKNDFFSSNNMITIYIVVVLIFVLFAIQKCNKNSEKYNNSEVYPVYIDTTAVAVDTAAVDTSAVDTSAIFTEVESQLVSTETKFIAKVSKKTLRINERLRIDFFINCDGDNFTPPNFKNFKIIAGPSQQISQSWINGKSSFIKSYSYFLLPLKKGILNINQATIEKYGKKYKTNSIVIYVIKTDN
ncbi:MAG: BatD family protein [Bacteroidia bacterium]|nr:BatD family protein [Bacteroidia bacterium]